ncbi:MAG: phosphotransferase [Dehalococcoidia bacterium]|nr:phosphotransferase [Dehalococcoidia bacterium]
MAKADLHLHSRVSDGLPTVARLLAYVEHHTDLDVVAVTDHEDARGGLLARDLAARRGYRVEIVVGAEVTTWQGHVLALFVEEAPPSFRSIESTLQAIHAAGGLAVIPHPLSWLTRSLSRRTIDRVVARGEAGVGFDAIELCNPSPAGRATARRAIRANARWRLPATGSSDAHHLLHVGTGWTEFPGQTAGDLRRALAEGTVQARMSHYPSLREIGYGRAALGLLWGYAATPRKMLTLGRRPRKVTP